MKEMLVGGHPYIEVKAPDCADVCRSCSFGQPGALKHCAEVVDNLAPITFGGDCWTNDVYYIPSPMKQKTEA